MPKVRHLKAAPEPRKTKRPASAKSKAKDITRSRRGVWRGSISFGLVNVPVELYSAKGAEELHFNMLDKRDHARVGYKQINKSTGEEIARANIVKGYEYERGEYVVLSDADFDRANVKATHTIEIEDFVFLDEIDVIFFDRAYYIVPQRGGEKGYALLREVLERTHKAGIGKIVLNRKQHLAALIVRNDFIVLELLRFADEVLALAEGETIGPDVADAKISPREIEVAEQLVETLTSKWAPDKYKDTYHDDLLKMIQSKIRSGKTATAPDRDGGEKRATNVSHNVVDLSALLRKSLEAKAKAKGGKSHARKRNA